MKARCVECGATRNSDRIVEGRCFGCCIKLHQQAIGENGPLDDHYSDNIKVQTECDVTSRRQFQNRRKGLESSRKQCSFVRDKKGSPSLEKGSNKENSHNNREANPWGSPSYRQPRGSIPAHGFPIHHAARNSAVRERYSIGGQGKLSNRTYSRSPQALRKSVTRYQPFRRQDLRRQSPQLSRRSEYELSNQKQGLFRSKEQNSPPTRSQLARRQFQQIKDRLRLKAFNRDCQWACLS